MNNLLSYSGINTKIKAMDSNLISNDDFIRIANLETVTDFITFLKNHPGYENFFSHYDEHELHRGDAERIFINSLYQDYMKLYRFASASQRTYLELLFFRYEVNILKACIRQIFNEENTYDLSLFQPFFMKHSKMNVPALAASKSMTEFIHHLKDTKYHPILDKLQNNAKNITTFDYVMQLDIYYYNKTWKLARKNLADGNQKSFIIRLGTEIDLLNIIWIYRSKKNFDMSPADVFSYIIPVNYKLSKAHLAKMASALTMDEFLSILKNSHYHAFYESITDGTIEFLYNKTKTKLYKFNKEKHPASMATVNHYLHMKEVEIDRLTTALECIRYNLDLQEKLKYI